MALIKWTLVGLAIGYLAFVALLYLVQRNLMYFPDRARLPPAALGLSAEDVRLDTPDGERLVAWHIPPRGDRPVVLYLHGNGGNLSHRVARFRTLTADGTGLVAVDYRGFGGSSGSPTESGLHIDAETLYAFAATRYAGSRIVVWGESLGTGVAVSLAVERPIGWLVLEAPFTAAVDVAARRYPFAPVHWLMKDQFRSDRQIARVAAPLLVLHGARDTIIPIEYGERLFALAHDPKRLVRFPDGEHEDLDRFGAQAVVKAFLSERLE
ncbi:MAG TPA: alpha/beta hydrolase [Xanthobacteraceae bacterium]|nr:alpha/beta hydrolase [Xanthobacteraceae bacterium]